MTFDEAKALEVALVDRLAAALRDPEAVAKKRRPSLEIVVATSEREFLTTDGYRKEIYTRLVAEWLRPEEGERGRFRVTINVGTNVTAAQIADARKDLARHVFRGEEIADRFRRFERDLRDVVVRQVG